MGFEVDASAAFEDDGWADCDVDGREDFFFDFRAIQTSASADSQEREIQSNDGGKRQDTVLRE